MSETYKCCVVVLLRCCVTFFLGRVYVFPRKIVYLYSENEKLIKYV